MAVSGIASNNNFATTNNTTNNTTSSTNSANTRATDSSNGVSDSTTQGAINAILGKDDFLQLLLIEMAILWSDQQTRILLSIQISMRRLYKKSGCRIYIEAPPVVDKIYRACAYARNAACNAHEPKPAVARKNLAGAQKSFEVADAHCRLRSTLCWRHVPDDAL